MSGATFMGRAASVLLISLLALLSGCGTVNTLTHSDEELANKLRDKKTRCESFKRVYGGIAYDFCSLHSEPRHLYATDWVYIYLIDMAFSAVADTVVLPYSIYVQAQQGDIAVVR